jgi:hypothetical protein
MAVRTRKRRHARLRAAGLGRRCECWGDLGEHQQAVDGLGEQERGKAEEGGLGIMKEAAVEAPDG